MTDDWTVLYIEETISRWKLRDEPTATAELAVREWIEDRHQFGPPPNATRLLVHDDPDEDDYTELVASSLIWYRVVGYERLIILHEIV